MDDFGNIVFYLLFGLTLFGFVLMHELDPFVAVLLFLAAGAYALVMDRAQKRRR